MNLSVRLVLLVSIVNKDLNNQWLSVQSITIARVVLLGLELVLKDSKQYKMVLYHKTIVLIVMSKQNKIKEKIKIKMTVYSQMIKRKTRLKKRLNQMKRNSLAY